LNFRSKPFLLTPTATCRVRLAGSTLARDAPGTVACRAGQNHATIEALFETIPVNF